MDRSGPPSLPGEAQAGAVGAAGGGPGASAEGGGGGADYSTEHVWLECFSEPTNHIRIAVSVTITKT